MTIKKIPTNGQLFLDDTLPNGKRDMTCISEHLLKEAVNMLLGNEVFTSLCEIQRLVWTDDDCMSQDTLFDLQDKVAKLTLTVAGKVSPESVDKLVTEFPWLYEVEGE